MCVECLSGKQKKPILFKVTEPSSVPYRAPPACAKRAAYPDPPPVILVPESIAAQAAYQLRYRTLSIISWVSSARNDTVVKENIVVKSLSCRIGSSYLHKTLYQYFRLELHQN